jgi:ABC-type antimicrobial peptide transport system permease subunit
MLKHYIRIAIRNLSRQKVLTIINISGLSLGLACFSLILLFAVNEFSYDRFRANADHIFRVDEVYTRDDGSQSGDAGLNMPLLSSLIASPMAWLVMTRWLRDFAYRIDIGWTVFVLTAFIALFIAFVTIGLQAVRAARANPVGNLRSE